MTLETIAEKHLRMRVTSESFASGEHKISISSEDYMYLDVECTGTPYIHSGSGWLTIHSFIHSFILPLGFTQCFAID